MHASASSPPQTAGARCNVGDRLAHFAAATPHAVAIVRANRRGYATSTFAELDADAGALARGLVDLGVQPGMRMALLVPPSVEFVKLVFALLRCGATTVLVDPGMGRRRLIDSLAGMAPDGFIAVPRAQAVRALLGRRFSAARLNVTVGRRLFWGGATYRQLLSRGAASRATLPSTSADDLAAVIFTSGSTGPPKGVCYTQRMFDVQAAEIQRAYQIAPGGVDLACFALFGLFNSAMGVTTVFPAMNFSRPAAANPRKLLAAARDWQVTQAFASPAVWDKLSRHGEKSGERIPTLRRVFSCGAPVPAEVLRRTLSIVAADAEMHTPYGATEALPVSTIEAREVLAETAAATAAGAGVCVGRKFETIEWRVIRITDEPIASLDDAPRLPAGEIGELIVRGPQVSSTYKNPPVPSPRWGGLGRGDSAPVDLSVVGHPPSPSLPAEGRGQEQNGDDPNALAKIHDGPTVWHRMGDVGYLDDGGRFWYCGRKSQRVETAVGALFPECVEPAFARQPHVERAALIGLGPPGEQIPIIVVEPNLKMDYSRYSGRNAWADFEQIAAAALPSAIETDWIDVEEFPVDVRHNSKIDREFLRLAAVDGILIERELFSPAVVAAAEYDHQYLADRSIVAPRLLKRRS